ncbi:hypothetical protein GCM10025779_15380 [Arthrobacter cryoconiti]
MANPAAFLPSGKPSKTQKPAVLLDPSREGTLPALADNKVPVARDWSRIPGLASSRLGRA